MPTREAEDHVEHRREHDKNLFSELKDLDIDDILQVVKGVIGELQDADELGFMTQKLPLVNKSLNEIVDFTDGVVQAVDSVLSAIDEDELKQAIEAVETAVANISLPLAIGDACLALWMF